jgi:hypothetical protein
MPDDLRQTMPETPAWFVHARARLVDDIAERVAAMMADERSKFERHVDDSAKATRENSANLASAILAQSKRVEDMVLALAEGHARIGSAHGHTSEKLRELMNGRADPGVVGGK